MVESCGVTSGSVPEVGGGSASPLVHHIEPHQKLALAVISQAVKDSKRGDEEASDWLTGGGEGFGFGVKWWAPQATFDCYP